MDTADFDQFLFGHGGKTRTVFTRGEGPAVIVCHELAGLSPTCLDLARRIAAESFTVFVPVLFGKPGQTSTLRGGVQVCLSREFTLLAGDKSSPISAWIRALAADTAGRAGHPHVAAIGMCVTGGIVLPVLLADAVQAAVMSQPSLPFAPTWMPSSRRGELGISPGELEDVRETGKQVLGLRFERDRICPPQRLVRLKEELPDTAEVRELPSESKGDHSVLTFHFVDGPGHPTREAFDRVISFLNENLRPEGGAEA